jgi:hypothetical protein
VPDHARSLVPRVVGVLVVLEDAPGAAGALRAHGELQRVVRPDVYVLHGWQAVDPHGDDGVLGREVRHEVDLMQAEREGGGACGHRVARRQLLLLQPVDEPHLHRRQEAEVCRALHREGVDAGLHHVAGPDVELAHHVGQAEPHELRILRELRDLRPHLGRDQRRVDAVRDPRDLERAPARELQVDEAGAPQEREQQRGDNETREQIAHDHPLPVETP